MHTTNKMQFRKEIQSLINKMSMENGSDTPDFLLAEYLSDCLTTFDRIVKAREKWHGRERELLMECELPTSSITGKHEHKCGCGCRDDCIHEVGSEGCIRIMCGLDTPVVKPGIYPEFYRQHPCGCWSRIVSFTSLKVEK